MLFMRFFARAKAPFISSAALGISLIVRVLLVVVWEGDVAVRKCQAESERVWQAGEKRMGRRTRRRATGAGLGGVLET